MTRLERVEMQIEQLSADELAKLRRWFGEFEALRWDREIDADLRVSDALAAAPSA